MIILSWNYRGLRNRRAVQVLANLVRQKGPTILFLKDTKLSLQEMQTICTELNFHGMEVVPIMGRSGGLALLWMNDVVVHTQTVSPNHIDTFVIDALQGT